MNFDLKCHLSLPSNYFHDSKMWRYLGLLLYILSFYGVKPTSNDLGEVVFAVFLFRHGDRTPIDPYPKDPYKNTSFWPTGWGELTNAGKKGHYELGKWLRERYKNFLPEIYDKKDIYVRSTDVDRALMSAYSNLAGLYEPDPKINWDPSIKWTPIPVHTTPRYLDEVLLANASCPKYRIEMEKLLNSKEFQKLNEKYTKLFEYLTKNTGLNVSCMNDAQRIYDSLFIENLYNFTLPNWTKLVYPQPLTSLAQFTFSIPCYTRTLARLKVGPLFGEILNHMQEKVSGTMNPDRKVWMYSAHDTTVANVLKGLNVFQPHCPPYLSLIIFELRKKNNDYFVALYYRNSSTIPPFFLQLEGCEKLCPFETYKKIVSPLIPEDWKEECKVTLLAENIYTTTASISFITMVSLAVLFLLSLTIVLRFYKNQKSNQVDFTYKSLRMDVTS